MPTWVRASAETMPCVTVCPTPNGLPMASTTSPTWSASELANSSDGKALMRVLDAQHGEVAALVLEHDLGLELALVGERHLDLVGALDHVHIGDDEAGRIDDHAGAERALHLPAAAVARHAEEAAEDRIVEQRIAVLHHFGGVDIDHRRRHALHHRRVGQPQLGGGRHPPLLRRAFGRMRRQCRPRRWRQAKGRSGGVSGAWCRIPALICHGRAVPAIPLKGRLGSPAQGRARQLICRDIGLRRG